MTSQESNGQINGTLQIGALPPTMPSQEDIERFLQSQGSTLWGKAFDIHSDAGRARAAEWFHKQVKGLFNQ